MNAKAGTSLVAGLKRTLAVAKPKQPTCPTCRYSTLPPVTLATASPLVRTVGDPSPSGLEGDFALYPNFFSLDETKALLAGSLWKLDRVDPVRKRRRRTVGAAPPMAGESAGPLQDLFKGDYGFQEGHYDSVIHDYRETTISSLPPITSFPAIPNLLNRAFALLPGSPQIDGESSDTLPPETISHLLHLAPTGKILGHVDNLEASGSVIMGICLGSDRILRLDRDAKDGSGKEGWEVLLKNGTVYLQKDKLRYEYEHSIIGYDESEWDSKPLDWGHRLSMMIRDAPSRPHK